MPANANADGTAKQLSCPRCEASPTLVARLVGDTLLDECPDCSGVWLDACAVDRLVRERRQVSTQAVLGMGGPINRGVLPINPPGRTYLKCPECETVMNRTNFAKKSGIIIDNCRGHGTWFDADELPRIVEFVMNGGIEAANEAELQKMQAEVRKERSKARAAQSQSMMMTPVSTKQQATANLFGGLLSIIGSVLD